VDHVYTFVVDLRDLMKIESAKDFGRDEVLGGSMRGFSRNLSKAVVEVQFRWWKTLRSRIHYTSHMQRDEYQTIRQVRIMSIVGIWCSKWCSPYKNISPAPTKGRLAKTRI